MVPSHLFARPRRSVIAARLRPLVVALAAVVLATGGVSPAIALSPGAAVGPADHSTVAAVPAVAPISTVAATASPTALGPRGLPATTIGTTTLASPPAVGTNATAGAAPKRVEALPPKAPTRTAATRSTKVAATTTFHGTNHLWIPALGIDRSTSSFACSRSQAPANYVYRWGCAGTNNVYLLGHAYGAFKALHDAYYNGRLRVGLTAVYANGSGTIHTYRVAWWRVVRPTTDAKWAWASLASPGMTLQTCLGANSQYRLMVRLVQVS